MIWNVKKDIVHLHRKMLTCALLYRVKYQINNNQMKLVLCKSKSILTPD